MSGLSGYVFSNSTSEGGLFSINGPGSSNGSNLDDTSVSEGGALQNLANGTSEIEAIRHGP